MTTNTETERTTPMAGCLGQSGCCPDTAALLRDMFAEHPDQRPGVWADPVPPEPAAILRGLS